MTTPASYRQSRALAWSAAPWQPLALGLALALLLGMGSC